jgi:hypothetical protein
MRSEWLHTACGIQRLKKNNQRRKPMKMKRTVALVLTGLLMVWAVVALAQDKPADNMRLVVEKIRADKKLFIAENMQLTENEATAFWPVYDRYQDELFLLRSRAMKLIQDYAGSFKNMTADTAKALLDEYMTIETLGLKLRQTYLSKFRGVLPEVKVLRYYQIENKIDVGLMYEIAAIIPLIEKAE